MRAASGPVAYPRASPRPEAVPPSVLPMSPVDTFLDERVLPEYRDTAEAVRAFMREAAPTATEQIYYGLPMWTVRKALAWISPSQTGIAFGFTYGATFDDPHGRLRGTGKHARHVRPKTPADVDPEVLRDYVRQALERDGA